MAEVAKDQDQSMEDILQSIKRIIAEEGEERPTPPAEADSDVLELTELLADDGSVSKLDTDDLPSKEVDSLSIDEIMAAPIAAAKTEPKKAVEPVKEAPQAPVPPAVTASGDFDADEEGEDVALAEMPVSRSSGDEGLISNNTLSASVAALNALRDSLTAPPVTSPAIRFRSGTTVEDLVVEALKPMLKEWLDENLPRIVESLVQKEISRLVR